MLASSDGEEEGDVWTKSPTEFAFEHGKKIP